MGWKSSHFEATRASKTSTFEGSITVEKNFTVNGNFTFGDAISDSLTVSGLYKQGTSSSPLVLTAGTPVFTLYSTNAGTSGSTDAEPLYVKSTLTGAGQVGGRCRFHTYSDVASGGWINAIKGYMEFGDSGSSSGLASAIVAEMKMPSATLGSGQYYPLEIEMEFQASTDVAGTAGSGAGFIYAKINGTTTDFDDEAGFFWLNGISAGAGHLLSADSTTIRCFVTSSMTARYLVTSRTENTLTLGATGSALSYTEGTPIISLHATNAGTSGGTNAEPLYISSTLTGTGQVGGRSKFVLNANAALGGWANAIKGETTFNASGSVTGLGSVVCGDLTLSTGTSSGTYAVFEGNIIAGSSASTGTNTGFFALNADGADEDTIDSNGFLIVGGDALDAASGKFFDTDITTHSAYGGIRIHIEGVGTKYIALVSD